MNRVKRGLAVERYGGGGALATASRVAIAMVAATVATLACGFATATASEQGCANEAIRSEQGVAFLPNCRAYELVSPPQATPSVAEGHGPVEGTLAATGGDGLAWFSYYPIEDSSGGFYNVSTRSTGGWSSEGVTPALSTWQFAEIAVNFDCQAAAVFSPEFTRGILVDGEASDTLESEGVVGKDGEVEFCGANEPSLADNEPKGANDIFVMMLRPRTYEVVNVTPSNVVPANAFFQDASEDDSHVVFSESDALTPEANEGGNNLYVWTEGTLRLVTVLPNGNTVNGTIADGAELFKGERPIVDYAGSMATHATSADGAQILFTANGNLYVRFHADAAPHQGAIDAEECRATTEACTIEVDASQDGGSGGGGKFVAASASGSEVFFSDQESAKLTSNTPTALGSDTNLYSYNTETGELADLTPVQEAKVLGYSGLGEDETGTNLYFAAEGSLASGALPREANLFVAHLGSVKFIASATQTANVDDWQPLEGEMGLLEAEASPDGNYFAFVNSGRLTKYNNTDKNTKERDEESYLYDDATGTITCVSCDPDEARPVGSSTMFVVSRVTQGAGPVRLRNRVFDDGDVIFESPDPLVPADESGQSDVYEYTGGAPELISGGKSTSQSVFYEANPSGENIFFATTQKLVRRDVNNAVSIYDARVGGGFAEPVPPPACEGEACRGAAPSSEFVVQPESVTGVGPGNPSYSSKKETTRTGTSTKERARSRALARALKACRREPRKHRADCRKRARRRYVKKGSGTANPKAKRATTRHGVRLEAGE